LRINTHVYDFETDALKHHTQQVFPDIMQIALYGTGNRFADWFDAYFNKPLR